MSWKFNPFTGNLDRIVGKDEVKDSMIDWGTGTDQVSSSDMPDHNSYTVRDTFTHSLNRGKSTAITITLTGGLGVSWTAGELYCQSCASFFEVDAGSGNVTDNAVNYLKWVSGTTLILSTTEPSGNEILIATGSVYDGNINSYRETSLMNETVSNTRRGLRALFPTRIISGMSVHEDTDATNPLDVTMDAGVLWKDAIEKMTPIEIKSRNTPMVRHFHTASAWDSDTNIQIETTNYDNGTQLTAIPVSKYVKGLFIYMAGKIGFVYPVEYFNTIAQAQDAALPAMPPGLAPIPKLTAIVYQQTAANFTGAIWQDVRAGISEESFAGVTDHGALVGLSDDDHPQYIKDAEFTQNSGILVGTGAGTFAEETGATLRTSIGCAAIDQTFYIGTTQVAINRASGALTLAGLTLTTPDIGTPSAGTLTNCSFPTLNQNTTGTAANLSGTPAIPDGTTATTQAPADNSTKLATTAYADTAAAGGGATAALDNLAAVQINTTLVSDTDVTDDLGTGDVRWKDTWFQTLSAGLTAADTLKLRGRDVDGAAYVDILTITSNNTVTADLNALVTIGGNAILYSGGDAGTPSALVGTNISGTAAGFTAGTVTNATFTTALTVDTGTLTLTANVANNSVLTIGAGAVSVSGSNTGDQDLSGKADVDQTMHIGTTAVAINRASAGLTLAGLTLTTPDIGTPSAGTLTNCSFPTLNQNTTGSAATLTTARTIGGVNFDGSANIVPNTITVADESTDTECFVAFFTTATGDLAPKTGTNLTFNSSTGVLTATGFAGPLTGNVTGDCSGSSGSCTGNSATATVATTVTITDNEATDEANPIVFVAGADPDGGNLGLETDGTCTYNPSTGVITTTGFAGALTGNVTGNCTGSSGSCTGESATVATIAGLAPNTATTQATQASITTCANLVTVGALDAGSITSGFTSIDVGAGAITTTGDITGGGIHVTGDTTAGDNAALGYTATEGLIMTGQGSANDLTFKNDADAEVMKVLTGTTTLTMAGAIQLGETSIKLDAALSGDAKWSGITIAGVSGVTTLAQAIFLITLGLNKPNLILPTFLYT